MSEQRLNAIRWNYTNLEMSDDHFPLVLRTVFLHVAVVVFWGFFLTEHGDGLTEGFILVKKRVLNLIESNATFWILRRATLEKKETNCAINIVSK